MKFSKFIDKVMVKYTPTIFNYNRDRYFNGDTSFYDKINTQINHLYISLKNSNVQFVKHDSVNGKLYFRHKDINIVTDYIVGNLLENFGHRIFEYSRNQIKKDTLVFDIGTNKGFSTLFFAQSPNVKKIIGFEIDQKLSQFVKENIELNPQLGDKMELCEYGLGVSDGTVDIYSATDNDSITTANKEFFDTGWTQERQDNHQVRKATIKKASSVISQYIEKYPNLDLFMSIDIEGAEYEVLKDLHENNLIDRFSIITGEFHNKYDELKPYFNNFELLEYSEKLNFKNIVGTFTLRRKI